VDGDGEGVPEFLSRLFGEREREREFKVVFIILMHFIYFLAYF